MLRMFTYLVALNLTVGMYAQQKKPLFSDAISLHLKKYNQRCNEAIENNDYERVTFLFDSLVKNHLKGTFLEDLKLKQLKGGYLNIKDREKPFLLTTTTSWYIKNDEEIEALNNLATEFKGKLDIIILFWDIKREVKKIARKYNRDIIITYIDESENKYNNIINIYKHALGFPTAFYITSDREIININRGAASSFNLEPDKTLYTTNYDMYFTYMTQLLVQNELSHNVILTDTD